MNALGVRILSRGKVLLNTFAEQSSLSPILPTCTQLRFKSKKKKKEKKEKEVFIPRFKRTVQEVPEVPPELVSKTPATDDVWIHKYYPVPTFKFVDALKRHREYSCPEMTDNVDGNVMLEVQLNLQGKTKTSFLEVPEGILLMPNDFDNFFPGRVVAITKDVEEQARAQEAGAVYSGGVDLIRKIEKGDIRNEDYDKVVLSENLLTEAAIIKKVLKELFPSKKNGTLDYDIVGMVKKYAYGKDYRGTRISGSEAVLNLPIGKLNFTDEQLTENVKALLATVKTQNRGGPRYYKKLKLTCPPSKEVFILEDGGIMPEIAVKAGKKGKKNVVKVVAQEAEKVEEAL